MFYIKMIEIELNNVKKSFGIDEILKNIRKSEEDSGVLLIGLHNKNNLEQDILFREKIKNYIGGHHNNGKKAFHQKSIDCEPFDSLS